MKSNDENEDQTRAKKGIGTGEIVDNFRKLNLKKLSFHENIAGGGIKRKRPSRVRNDEERDSGEGIDVSSIAKEDLLYNQDHLTKNNIIEKEGGLPHSKKTYLGLIYKAEYLINNIECLEEKNPDNNQQEILQNNKEIIDISIVLAERVHASLRDLYNFDRNNMLIRDHDYFMEDARELASSEVKNYRMDALSNLSSFYQLLEDNTKSLIEEKKKYLYGVIEGKKDSSYKSSKTLY
jgi:hypothetical protein